MARSRTSYKKASLISLADPYIQIGQWTENEDGKVNGRVLRKDVEDKPICLRGEPGDIHKRFKDIHSRVKAGDDLSIIREPQELLMAVENLNQEDLVKINAAIRILSSRLTELQVEAIQDNNHAAFGGPV